MLAIRAASQKLASERLTAMISMSRWKPCASVRRRISFARLRRLYFGAADEKGGAVVNDVPSSPHPPAPRAGCLSRMGESEASIISKDFFASGGAVETEA